MKKHKLLIFALSIMGIMAVSSCETMPNELNSFLSNQSSVVDTSFIENSEDLSSGETSTSENEASSDNNSLKDKDSSSLEDPSSDTSIENVSSSGAYLHKLVCIV